MKLSKEARDAFRAVGKKGGKARAKNLTDEQLSEIGRKGAATRWASKREEKALAS